MGTVLAAYFSQFLSIYSSCVKNLNTPKQNSDHKLTRDFQQGLSSFVFVLLEAAYTPYFLQNGGKFGHSILALYSILVLYVS